MIETGDGALGVRVPFKINKGGLGAEERAIKSEVRRCSNIECGEFEVTSLIVDRDDDDNITVLGVYPSSSAKPQPEYIPHQLVSDYIEACNILSLSPKASATLARRCLQGMIRDFWGISKPRLVDEIAALRDVLDDETWAAVDGLRKLGNIGAHMERDINVITDVDPNEAGLLVALIETLFEEWYVRRNRRTANLRAIAAAAAAK